MSVWKNVVRYVDEKEEVMAQGCGINSTVQNHD
jgi:hypothetical protein